MTTDRCPVKVAVNPYLERPMRAATMLLGLLFLGCGDGGGITDSSVDRDGRYAGRWAGANDVITLAFTLEEARCETEFFSTYCQAIGVGTYVTEAGRSGTMHVIASYDAGQATVTLTFVAPESGRTPVTQFGTEPQNRFVPRLVSGTRLEGDIEPPSDPAVENLFGIESVAIVLLKE
jgi:hypothetical protein